MSEQLRIAGNIQSYMSDGLDWIYHRPLLQLEHCSESSANNVVKMTIPEMKNTKVTLIMSSVQVNPISSESVTPLCNPEVRLDMSEISADPR